MASESSSGFHHQQQGILFKSGGATSSSSSGSGGCELIPMANFNYRNGGGSLNLSGNDGRGGVLFSSQNSLDSCLTHVMDSAPGLKHDTGFAVEWSMEEQYKLEEGLAKYAYEPNIARYVKIAASLPDKTVRDVALRCRWMMRKRRKQEHQSLRKTVKDQKNLLELASQDQHFPQENLAETTLISSAPSANVAPYSSSTINHNQSDCKFLGGLSGTARHLIEENNQAFEQILVNLSTLKLQQNIDLLFRTRNNIIAILNVMRNMPGIMSHMPPLPVLLNDELASTIFPPSSQAMMFSSLSTMPVKQEPGC